jgi:hypothetical protein
VWRLRWMIEDVFWTATCTYSARQPIVLLELAFVSKTRSTEMDGNSSCTSKATLEDNTRFDGVDFVL